MNNACSTGSTALFLAKQLIEGGMADCVMALGFEKMQPGSLSATVSVKVLARDPSTHLNDGQITPWTGRI